MKPTNAMRRYPVALLVTVTAAINLLYALKALQVFLGSPLTGAEQQLAISAISANLGLGIMLCWAALSLQRAKAVLPLLIIPLLTGSVLQSYTRWNAGDDPVEVVLNLLAGLAYCGILGLGYRYAGKTVLD